MNIFRLVLLGSLFGLTACGEEEHEDTGHDHDHEEHDDHDDHDDE